MIRTLIILCSLVALTSNSATGDWVLNYSGLNFSAPFVGSAFDTSSKVSGTVTFNNVGDATASSFTLTVSGPAGLTFTNAGNVTVNSFGSWSNGLPGTWSLTVTGNIIGAAAEEQISIGNIGDIGAVDLFAGNQSVGSSQPVANPSLVWTVAAVPEPSTMVMSSLAMAGTFWAARRRKQSTKS